MDAIVMAGGINKPDDPLYTLVGIEKKALIPLAGKPMIDWVIDALSGSGLVEHMVIAGLSPDEVTLRHRPIHFVAGVGGIIDNVLVAVDELKRVNPATSQVLLCMSDIPLITQETVKGFVEECGSQEADLYYAIIEKQTMETQFPDSKRTFVPVKDGRFSGGDIWLADITVPEKTKPEIFRMLTDARKNYLAQARALGIGFIIRLLLRRVTIEETAERARKLLNIDIRVVRTKYAELGMDLDKPHQYRMIKSILERRQAEIISNQV